MTRIGLFNLFTLTVIGISTPLAAADPSVQSAMPGTSSNGSSTGVGNAGSFGIGSGTSDSISTATATSNGIQDSSTDNSVDNSMSISTVGAQELQASNTNNRLTVSSPTPGAPIAVGGSNAISGNAFANYTGILNNGWNSAPAGIAQAGTNVVVNGNLSPSK